jgi:hypothetical protein
MFEPEFYVKLIDLSFWSTGKEEDDAIRGPAG